MLKADIRHLESALSKTLRLPLKRVRAILAYESNAWRLRHVSMRSMEHCVVVPDAQDVNAVVYVPKPNGVLQMFEVLKLEEADLTEWSALPDEDRAKPANMPVFED